MTVRNALLKREKVRRFLGVSRPTLAAIIARGDLPVVRIGPRSLRVSESALMEFVKTRTERRAARQAATRGDDGGS